MSALVRIVVTNPDNVARVGIRTLLSDHPDLVLLGETAHYNETLALCARLSPEILLLSAAIPYQILIDCIHSLATQTPPIATLVLAADYDAAVVQAVVQAGAAGYFLVSDPISSLVHAIRTVMDGGTWFSQAIIRQLVQTKLYPFPQPFPAVDPLAELTEREREVLELLTRGWTNQHIGHTLGITERTIRFHVRNIFDKLNFKTRGEAIAWAVRGEQTHRDMPTIAESGNALPVQNGKYKLAQAP
ncbi:MAG: response regulator transcription factor [Caldilineaceae bacterium]